VGRGNTHYFDKVIVRRNVDHRGIIHFNGPSFYINNGGRAPPHRPSCSKKYTFQVYIDDLEINEGNALIISGVLASGGFSLK